MTNNLSSHLRIPRKLAEEQLILNIPTNSSGSEFSATTKIPGHHGVERLNVVEYRLAYAGGLRPPATPAVTHNGRRRRRKIQHE